MDMQEVRSQESRKELPPGAGVVLPRRRGGRWRSMRAEARRRRLTANAVVLGTTGAVIALAALFNHVLSR